MGERLYDVIRRNLSAVQDMPSEAHRPSPIVGEASEFGIDPKIGLSVVGGNLVHYRELLRELSTSARALLDICRRAGRVEDHREPAHSLRGAAGLLGAHHLAAVAAAIESVPGTSADTAVDEALTSSLHNAIVLVERYLQADEPGHS